MSINKFCPGSIAIKNPVPDYVECPWCKGEVEIWSDEVKATCPNCKMSVFKDRGASCIDWCQHAEKCVGTETLKRLRGEKAKTE
jgi:hypothetical protein